MVSIYRQRTKITLIYPSQRKSLHPWGMANVDVIAFNIAAFICGLFVLEFGADTFIDHTAIVARRTGISQSLIGLLTAGAEWEEVRA